MPTSPPAGDRQRNLPHLARAAEALRTRRLAQGLTQTGLAKKAGVSAGVISNAERGLGVEAETLRRLGHALGTEPVTLLADIALTGEVPGSVGADREPSGYVAKVGDEADGGGLSDELLDMLARSYRQGYEAGRADRARPVGSAGGD